jgi:hypothetical protein
MGYKTHTPKPTHLGLKCCGKGRGHVCSKLGVPIEREIFKIEEDLNNLIAKILSRKRY